MLTKKEEIGSDPESRSLCTKANGTISTEKDDENVEHIYCSPS